MKLTFKILLPMALLGILFTSCGNRQKRQLQNQLMISITAGQRSSYKHIYFT